jgi:hypothetical protein
MPVMKRDINTRSLDEFFVSAQRIEEPKNPPKLRMPKPKMQARLQLNSSKVCYVLTLNSRAPLQEILNVYNTLRSDLESQLTAADGLLLLANDKVLEKYREDLHKNSIFIPKDWKEEQSDYRQMLRLAKEQGRIYEMVKENSRWTYKEVKGT